MGPAFNRLWAASTAGNLGDGVHRVAVPLLAARLTSDPVAFSALAALGYVPWLLLGLPSGVLVDRHDRRKLAVAVGVVRTLAVAALLTAVALDAASLWLLYAVVVVLGACETVYDNAVHSMVPTVVGDRNRLENANGRFQGAELLAQSFLAPPLASGLFALVASAAFGVNVACYALAALLMLTLPGRYGPAADTPREPMVRAMGSALRFVWGHQAHRALLSTVLVLGFSSSVATAVVVLWARDTLGVPEALFGVLMLATSIGALAGSQTAAPLAARIGRGRTMQLSIVVFGATTLGLAAVGSPYAAAAIWALGSCSVLWWNVVYGSLRQRLTPDGLLGRTIGIYRVVAWGCMPVGALTGGLVADAFGLRAPLAVAGTLTLLVSLYGLVVLSNDRIARAVAQADEDARTAGREPVAGVTA